MVLRPPDHSIAGSTASAKLAGRRLKCRRARAFTLVEVILAIVIALGILVVLLYFYQQATNLRAQAILETERIASARLLMDRITSELSSSQSEGALEGLVGGPN